MSVKRRPEPEPETVEETSIVSQGTRDPLAGYRESLKDLQSAQEKLTTLQSIQADIEGQLARAELDDEAALQRASEADDLGAAESDERGRIADRLKVLRRKIGERSKRLSEAQAELTQEISTVSSSFQGLYRQFLAWTIERERAALAANLIPGCGDFSIDRVTLHLRTVDTIRHLEPIGGDLQAVTASAERLLAAVEREPAFVIPPSPPATPVGPASASAAPQEDDYVGLPWDDGTGRLQLEMQKLTAEGATLADIFPRLKARCPHFFRTKEQILEQNKSLIPEATPWKSEMIGSTVLEPAERDFSHT